MAARPRTYRTAGVDTEAADHLVDRIGRLAAGTKLPGVLCGVGLFSAALRLPRGYRNPVLTVTTDGVGTKLALARMAGVHDSIGIDLVAMNVNDLLTGGARPLCFLDYLAVGKLSSVPVEAIIGGIARGCRMACVSLVGGETAEMPGFYRRGEYDLAGFAAGIVERSKLLTGSKIRPGDALIGLASSGLHSNGYSLVRAALAITSGSRLARIERAWPSLSIDELLRPTAIYVQPVLAALDRFSITGMAHVTGGGIPGNLVRILPTTTRATIERHALPQQAVFDAIQRAGRIRQAEMDRTFNCGVGFILVTRPQQVDRLLAFLQRHSVRAHVIGRVERGTRGVLYRH